MKRLSHWFRRIRGAIPGLVLWATVSRMRPHEPALARTGIRIVALASEEAEAYSKQEEVSVALSLLAQHEPIRMRRVSRSIRLILIGAIVRAGVYVESRRICVLNTKAIP